MQDVVSAQLTKINLYLILQVEDFPLKIANGDKQFVPAYVKTLCLGRTRLKENIIESFNNNPGGLEFIKMFTNDH